MLARTASFAFLLAPAAALARDLSDHGIGWRSGVVWALPIVALMVFTLAFVAKRIRTRRARRGLGPR